MILKSEESSLLVLVGTDTSSSPSSSSSFLAETLYDRGYMFVWIVGATMVK
jgi:hypothetical protein